MCHKTYVTSRKGQRSPRLSSYQKGSRLRGAHSPKVCGRFRWKAPCFRKPISSNQASTFRPFLGRINKFDLHWANLLRKVTLSLSLCQWEPGLRVSSSAIRGVGEHPLVICHRLINAGLTSHPLGVTPSIEARPLDSPSKTTRSFEPRQRGRRPSRAFRIPCHLGKTPFCLTPLGGKS